MLVVFFFVARAGPACFVPTSSYDVRRVAAAGLFQATTLSVPVVAVRLGMQLHNLDADTAAAIITAGLVTVLVFPPIALTLLSRAHAADAEASS